MIKITLQIMTKNNEANDNSWLSQSKAEPPDTRIVYKVRMSDFVFFISGFLGKIVSFPLNFGVESVSG